jgi:hypothetical protein
VSKQNSSSAATTTRLNFSFMDTAGSMELETSYDDGHMTLCDQGEEETWSLGCGRSQGRGGRNGRREREREIEEKIWVVAQGLWFAMESVETREAGQDGEEMRGVHASVGQGR